MEYYIAQIFGAIALITVFISYQKSKKKDFLIIQILANFLYAMQYILLKAYSGCSSSCISMIKTLTFYNYEKNSKNIPIIVLSIFEIAFIVGGILTFEGLYSLIPVFIHCVYTLGTWFKDLKITYSIAIFTAILWIVYCLIVGAHVAILANLVELIAAISGLRRIHLERKENKC